MILLLALLPWLGAVLVVCLPSQARRGRALLSGAATLAALGIVLALAPAVLAG